jgi:hypothetical protein
LQDALLDDWLEAGDMLYFPRGSIHYGVTCSEQSSHHLTVSTYQKTCWADLIALAVQGALADLSASDLEFRRGLPINWFAQFGSGVSNLTGKQKAALGYAADAASRQPFANGVASSHSRSSVASHMKRLLKVEAPPPTLQYKFSLSHGLSAFSTPSTWTPLLILLLLILWRCALRCLSSSSRKSKRKSAFVRAHQPRCVLHPPSIHDELPVLCRPWCG